MSPERGDQQDESRGLDEREIVNMFDEWNLSMRLNAGISSRSRPWIDWRTEGRVEKDYNRILVWLDGG